MSRRRHGRVFGSRRPDAGPSRGEAALWLLAGTGALGLAWWAQHVQGMAPCALCLWERWPYRVLAALGLLMLLLARQGLALAWLLRALVVTVLVAALAIAMLHVGVEQGWWPSPLPECLAPHFGGGTVAERLAAMPLRPSKPCDSPNRLFAWLPVSMTTLDAAFAAVLLLPALVLPVGRRR